MRRYIDSTASEKDKMRALLAVLGTIFVSLMGFGIIIPILPKYAQERGATQWEVGVIFASFSIAQMLASPYLGGLSDRIGRRPVLVFSMFGSVASFAILALATSMPLVLLSRVVDGLSAASVVTARAYIADLLAEHERAKGYGMMGAAFGLGFIAGPAIGGQLARIGPTAPAWGAAGLSLIAMILAWLYVSETQHASQARGPNPLRHAPGMLGRPILGRILFVNLLVWSCFAVYHSTFPEFGMKQFGFKEWHLGNILALVGGTAVVTQLYIMPRLVKLYGERSCIAGGLAVCALGLVGAATTRDSNLFIAMAVPITVGGAFASPCLTSLLSQTAGKHEMGLVQGVANSLESLGRIIGPLWGYMIMAKGISLAWLSAGLVMVGVAAFALTMKPAANTIEATGV